jgi:hypothetical protein
MAAVPITTAGDRVRVAGEQYRRLAQRRSLRAAGVRPSLPFNLNKAIEFFTGIRLRARCGSANQHGPPVWRRRARASAVSVRVGWAAGSGR